MKNFLLSLMSVFAMVSFFSCTAPSSGTTSKDSTPAPLPPHVTVDDLKNTVYTGERSQWKQGETDKFLYLIFKPTASGNSVSATIGKGMTPDEAKANAHNGGQHLSVTIKFPLTLSVGNSMTLYMAEDLQSGHTTKRVYVGNSIEHIKDAVLYKQ